MFDLGKCILVTNNDRAAEKWGDKVDQVVPVETYEEVLLKTRDLIHTNHKLLTHPQASSLKPNQTPYRTILLYSETGKRRSISGPPLRRCLSMMRRLPTITRPLICQ